ncbi:MAG TPA: protein kinase, partial [bacterium]|nr:protein kinase [bacterium]
MECPKCHSENAPDSQYCSHCGTGLSHGLPYPSGAAAQGDTSFQQSEPPVKVVTNLVSGSIVAGRYRIIERIGRGGMGVVYKAVDIRLERLGLRRLVALKFLPLELTWSDAAKQRFVREAEAASALDHQNICTFHDVDETANGQMFIVMAFCEGESLAKVIERGPVKPRDAVGIAVGVCEGLAAAHEAGIIHRDIKPGNIMVKDAKHVKIVDFGLAILAGETRMTRPGVPVGTDAYMSPEQAECRSLDHRTDIWSLGVVMYEMLTGQLPFKDDSKPDPPGRIASGIIPEFDGVVMKCLERDPAQRYQDALYLGMDLDWVRRLYDGPVPPPSRLWEFLKRHRIAVGLVAAAVLAVVALASLPRGHPVLDTNVVKSWLGMTSAPRARYVALLPFGIEAGSPRERALCDGLVELTTTELTRLAPSTNSLWVVPSGEVRQDKVTTAQEARTKLRANRVLTGSMGLSGGVISLTADLVDTETLRSLKHFTLADPMANLATWQDSLIQRTTRMLGAHRKPTSYAFLKVGCTTVPDAYESYLRGRGYLYPFGSEKAETDSSIAAFKQAIAKDPAFAHAYEGLGRAYLQKKTDTNDPGWLDISEVACERALKLASQLPTALSLKGWIEYNRQKYDNAIDAFERAIHLDPKYAEPYQGMGMAYYYKAEYCSTPAQRMEVYRSAVAACKQAIRLQPGYYRTYFYLGDAYRRIYDYKHAIDAFQAMVDLRPERAKGYTCLGAAYFDQKREDDARRAFNQAERVEPTYEVYNNIATTYFFNARYADAADMYGKALTKKPGNYRFYANYAECCFWTPSQRDKSRPLFEKAIAMAESTLQVTTDSLQTLADLASYCSMISDTARAEAYLRLPVSRDPSDEWITIRIAETYEGLGQREAALA